MIVNVIIGFTSTEYNEIGGSIGVSGDGASAPNQEAN